MCGGHGTKINPVGDIAPDGIRNIATTPNYIYNITTCVFHDTYTENITNHPLKECPIAGWSVVCPQPTTFLRLIHSPVALRLDNRCPWHQFLVPPQLPALVPERLPIDITEAVGIPVGHVDGEQCDVSDRLHAKDKQHKPMTRYMLLHSMSDCRRNETAK